jgi:hypothetical protein
MTVIILHDAQHPGRFLKDEMVSLRLRGSRRGDRDAGLFDAMESSPPDLTPPVPLHVTGMTSAILDGGMK